MRMRKILSSIAILLIMVMSLNSVAFASDFNPSEFTSITVESNLLPREVRESTDFMRTMRRGVFFFFSYLKIANNDGDIDVAGHAYMSEAVDEIYMTIYLDRQVIDEDGDVSWENVDIFEFEFYAEDYPEGELTSESVEFTLTGYPKNEYYRLRGAYAAVKDGLLEGFGPVTDGVYIH